MSGFRLKKKAEKTSLYVKLFNHTHIGTSIQYFFYMIPALVASDRNKNRSLPLQLRSFPGLDLSDMESLVFS